MTLLARSTIPFRSALLVFAALSLSACNEPKSRPAEKMAAADAARRLEPVGGGSGGEDADAGAGTSGETARLADEDMVTEVQEQRVAVSDARPETRSLPEPPAPSQKPAAAPETPKPTPAPKPPPADKQAKPAAKGQKTYVVQRGDSLWKIAQKQYGDGRAWRKIYNANRGRIANPSDVPIGTKLIIP